MSTKNELLIRIDEKYPKFSKGQKRLADYIKENYDKAAFLTAARGSRCQRINGCPFRNTAWV